MTRPPAPLFDAGNSLLGSVPVQLDTGSVDGPAGKIGVITLRTASTTLTAFLAPDELRKWAALLSGLADGISGGLTVASAADVAALERRGKAPK